MRVPVTQELFTILMILLVLGTTVLAKRPGVYYNNKSAPANVYLIRHGEKPADDSDPNLSSQGVQRASCIANLFVKPNYNIGKIIAQKPNKTKSGETTQARPFETVQPLAEVLHLTVDTSCKRDEAQCVDKLVQDWMKGVKDGKEQGDVLICWEHERLTDILKAMGVRTAPDYPSSHFDLIWKVNDGKIVSQTSENCPGLDNSVRVGS